MTNSDFTEIPVIDLLLADNVATRPQLLARLRSVLTEIGFLYVSNHGIPPAVIADLIGILPTLFALPDSAKAAIALHNSPHFLGYSAVGSETTAGRLDQREQVEFATELSVVNDRGPLYERLRGPNQWPAELPNLRPIVERYIAELTSLGERFLRLVAEALSLPTEAFLSYLSDQHRLKLVRYPPSSTQGVGPHKDSSGWWTFLLQASPNNVRGLQVLNKAGAWIDVPALPGTLVVNIGQAFEVVTHGVCKATTHRVLANQERFSVPFFQGVRRSLTREQALALADHFAAFNAGKESEEGEAVDSPFLSDRYETWGEAQLRTKIRSHRENGRKFYTEVYDKYVNESA